MLWKNIFIHKSHAPHEIYAFNMIMKINYAFWMEEKKEVFLHHFVHDIFHDKNLIEVEVS